MQPVEKLKEKIKQTIAYLQANGISIPPELLPVDDTVREDDLAELTENVNADISRRIEEVSIKTASALIGHKKDTANPHKVTAQQVGADRFGSADVVKYKLNNHVKDAGNPHAVTAEQAGADKLGSADVVQRRLSSHAQDTGNPHKITAKQIGAEELGGVDDALAQLGQHTLDLGNPHRVTAAQLGVDNISLQLDEHIQDNNNPHVVTSEQVGSPRLVIDAEVDHLVAFLTPTGEQKDSGKSIWDFAPVEHIHPTPIPMMMSGGVKQMTLTAGDLTATAPLLFNVTRQVVGGPANVSIPMATALVDGYLSAIDWTIFNNKQNALVFPLAANLGGTGVANAGTLTNANNTIITGGGTLTLGGFTATVPITGITAMGAGTLTSITVNDVTVAAHTHAITLAPGLLGNGTAQYQTIITGAVPFAPGYSTFFLDGTAGGKTVFAVTNTKTLTLTSTGDFNLTVPATGTAALLATANVFTTQQMVDGTSDQIQLRVQGHSTQIANIITVEKSDGSLYAMFGGVGGLTLRGTTLMDVPAFGVELLSDAGWTSVNWTGSWSTGWTHTPTFSTALSNTLAAVAGTRYNITYTVTGRTTGSFLISFGGFTTAYLTADGGFGPTARTTANLVITPTAAFDGTIFISIKTITTGGSTVLATFQSSESTSRMEIRANTALDNIFIGAGGTGKYNFAGTGNTAIGAQALLNNTSGLRNTALGSYALQLNTTGMENFGLGRCTLQYCTAGDNNTGVGSYALQNTSIGYGNTGIASFALQNNTTGYDNTAIGIYSMQLNTTGYQNTAVGRMAMYTLRPTSKEITAFADYSGTVAGTVKVTSVAHGLPVGPTASIGIYGTTNYNGVYTVTYIDANNFYFTKAWVYNDATGWWGKDLEGRYNVAIGWQAGRTIITGNSNVFIGTNAGYHASQLPTAQNSMALGYATYTTANNQVVLGNTSVVAIGIGTYSPTAHIHIVGNSDTPQLILQGNATQTTNPFELQKSTGAVQISFDDNGGAIFNEAGNATGDFRVESDTYNALFVDASNDSVMVMSNVAGKIGFYGIAALAQQAHIVDADGSLADATTKINAVLVRLEMLGLIASA